MNMGMLRLVLAFNVVTLVCLFVIIIGRHYGNP
jgi:hypothetical protein